MEYRISGHTELYCLIGSPVGHSLSPAMYNYSFARTGIDAVYLAFDLPQDKLKEGLDAIRTFRVKGFNVTMPNKTAIMEHLDEVTPSAKLIGACNTVTVTEDGKLIGYNTDCIGFANNLRSHGITMQGKKVILMGTGGAATAICVQAALDGAAEVSIFNRRDEFFDNGVQLVKRVSKAIPSCKVTLADIENQELFSQTIQNGDILINATKIGMKPSDGVSLVNPSLLRPELVVADTVYNPQETRLIKDARTAGCKAAIGGLGMLLWQGVAAFKLFTGQEMPRLELQDEFFSE